MVVSAVASPFSCCGFGGVAWGLWRPSRFLFLPLLRGGRPAAFVLPVGGRRRSPLASVLPPCSWPACLRPSRLFFVVLRSALLVGCGTPNFRGEGRVPCGEHCGQTVSTRCSLPVGRYTLG